jgi:hypothetical protein
MRRRRVDSETTSVTGRRRTERKERLDGKKRLLAAIKRASGGDGRMTIRALVARLTR